MQLSLLMSNGKEKKSHLINAMHQRVIVRQVMSPMMSARVVLGSTTASSAYVFMHHDAIKYRILSGGSRLIMTG